MKKILAMVLAVMASFAFVIVEADAKRFGGGRSIGQQRSTVTQQQAAPRQAAAAPAAAAPASGASRWLGPLAGLAMGGLLASMFMGGAFDGIKPMDILLFLGIAAAIFFIFRAMRKNQPAMRPMQYAGNTGPVVTPVEQSYVGGGASVQPATAEAWPSWFEAEPFVRGAKSHFIRLQAAYDDRDLKDIRNYTTPEMYAEISLQVQEMGVAKQQTEVVTLNAEVLSVVVEGDTAIASVRFSGLVREEADGTAEPLNEVWHVQKTPAQSNEGWLVAGIQQA